MNSVSSIDSELSTGPAVRHVRDQPLREQVQAQQRVGIVAQRRDDRRRQQRAQRRVQVARLQDPQQAGLAQPHGVAITRAVVDRAAEGVLAQLCGQAREIGESDWR